MTDIYITSIPPSYSPIQRSPYVDYVLPTCPQNQYLAPQVPEQVLQMPATVMVRFFLVVMWFLLGRLTVPLEEVRESPIILIMHGGRAATFAAARYLVAAVVLSGKHCQELHCCGECYHNTDPADGVTQSLCQCQPTWSPGVTASN